ncbi:hypothetical protein ACFL27_21390 [candidate division CSSED10-310 bacterium]|uniref:Uncharacterized protein n=1 Tax=candidate division CSSED10-310 bacterium TaxID=2855610 RepID=A0ABV6Z2S7_UNCC1
MIQFCLITFFCILLYTLGRLTCHAFHWDQGDLQSEPVGSIAPVYVHLYTGILLTSSLVIVLLVVGIFSLFYLLGSLFICNLFLGLNALLVSKSKTNSRFHKSEKHARARDHQSLIFIVFLVCFAFFLFYPPLESYIDGSDATIYLNAGYYFSNEGAISTSETLRQFMTPDEERWFFSNRIEGRPLEWVRFPGGFIFTTCKQLLSFIHAFNAWLGGCFQNAWRLVGCAICAGFFWHFINHYPLLHWRVDQ